MMAVWNMQIQKHFWPLCAVMGFLLSGFFTFAFCPHTARAAAPTNEGAKVSIANFAFVPAEITISPGDSVTWTNDDGAPHGLEFNDGAPGIDPLLPKASFSRLFERPGTYDYNCSVHPYMTGRVVVRPQ